MTGKNESGLILCCGEALVDMIPSATVSGADGFVPHSGGAIFNTAIALGRLGVTAGMLTGLSTDLFGQQLKQGLSQSNVETDFVIENDRPTTLAFVQLVDGHASYVFYDENSAGRMLTPEDVPSLPDNVSALYFGGISLACEPCADAYAALLEREAARRVVMIDPNIRPGFIRDETRYRNRLEGMIGHADIVKISDEDLNWLIPGSEANEEKARSLLGKGTSMVVLTRGSDGSSAFMRNGTSVDVAAEKVDVVDTVGAGDTFNAGLLSILSQNDLIDKTRLQAASANDVEHALQFGAKVAAVTVSRAGANPPWVREL